MVGDTGDGDTGNGDTGDTGDTVTVPPQFLCLRNIRTFLTACADKFGLPKHRLFGAFDLFDVQDFGKVGSRVQLSWGGQGHTSLCVTPPMSPVCPQVIETLSTLSWTPIAQSKGFT